jgi:hypothetical protein
MIGFAAQRLMELEVGEVTGAAHGERSADRLVQCNGYRDCDWQTRGGTVELRIPKLRGGPYGQAGDPWSWLGGERSFPSHRWPPTRCGLLAPGQPEDRRPVSQSDALPLTA